MTVKAQTSTRPLRASRRRLSHPARPGAHAALRALSMRRSTFSYRTHPMDFPVALDRPRQRPHHQVRRPSAAGGDQAVAYAQDGPELVHNRPAPSVATRSVRRHELHGRVAMRMSGAAGTRGFGPRLVSANRASGGSEALRDRVLCRTDRSSLRLSRNLPFARTLFRTRLRLSEPQPRRLLRRAGLRPVATDVAHRRVRLKTTGR